MKRRKSGQRGIKFIGGREYLLGGRYDDRSDALQAAEALRRNWTDVRVRASKNARMGAWSVWTHGAK